VIIGIHDEEIDHDADHSKQNCELNLGSHEPQ
jgi:hypothetical protein